MTNLQLASACRLRISILDTLQSSVQIWHMSDKRPIDLKRDSAFSGSVGNDDEGDLKEFLNIGHTLLMIKENATSFNLQIRSILAELTLTFRMYSRRFILSAHLGGGRAHPNDGQVSLRAGHA